ncbi:MAG: hypothetical protein ABH873_04165 [Candidatus Firestonebacteria bacterium]
MTKKILLICFVLLTIGGILIFGYSYNQKEKERIQVQNVQRTLEELTKAANMIDSIKEEAPKELKEVHDFFVKQNQEGKFKLYQISQELEGKTIMYHGVKTKGIYVDPSVNLKTELWIPIFYHEVAHNYWHSQNPVQTFEEFQAQLFDSENYAYMIEAQAWNLVMKYYPIEEGLLKTEIEQRLFRIYTQDTEVYNAMMKDSPGASELWNKIIEEDIKYQKEYQGLLFGE